VQSLPDGPSLGQPERARHYEFGVGTLSKFSGISESRLRHWVDDRRVDTVIPNTPAAAARDLGVQKLRDLTIAVIVAAAAAVGVIAWVSAQTIPGFADSTGPTGSTSTGLDDQSITSDRQRDGFNQGPTARSRRGTGMAVSGGSS
jgi:hypothetical protein